MNQASTKENPGAYAFDDYRVDPAKRIVFKLDSEPIPLKAKAFETLLYLVENAGRVVERDELLSAIWGDTIVEENNLTQHISSLRRLFGEAPGDHRYIVTVPGRGYKFVANVQLVDAAESANTVVNPLSLSKNGSRFWLIALAIVILASLMSMGLYWWTGRTSTDTVSIRSIAVLPFKPLTNENRDESLEMGMSDALITKLGGSEGLAVRPLAAVRRFNSPDQNPIEAGQKLGVEAVLEGNIQIANDRVRISATLFRVSDSKQLWAGQFDEKLTHIFVLQDSISERVANALKIRLGSRGAKRYTENVEAYQLYMKGNFHTQKLILPEVQKGISYYEQAIVLDPSYALAYVGMANACRAMVLTNDAPPNEVMPKAKAAVLKAIELDDSLAEARNALAFITFWYDWDPRAAEIHHIRALELDPNSAPSHYFYAHMLSNMGRHDEALSEIKRAKELDPISLATNAIEGQILFFAGKDDESLKTLQATAEMDPNFWLAPLFMTRIYIKKGMYDEAIVAATKARDITHGNAEAIAIIGYALARSGRSAEARAVLKELEDRATKRYVASYTLAAIHNGLGEKEKALDLLEKAFVEKDALMVFLKVEPKWDNLRSEPRFIELMKGMGFE